MAWKGYSRYKVATLRHTTGSLVHYLLYAAISSPFSSLPNWLLTAFESPKEGEEGDCGSLSRKTVPSGPCFLLPFVWAVMHKQWKADAAWLVRPDQKKPCSIHLDLLDCSALEPSYQMVRSPCHMERPHAGAILEGCLAQPRFQMILAPAAVREQE